MADYSDLAVASAAVQDPATPAAELPNIAAAQPSLRAQLVSHPNMYPGLLDWLEAQGDPAVVAAVAGRRSQDSTQAGPVTGATGFQGSPSTSGDPSAAAPGATPAPTAAPGQYQPTPDGAFAATGQLPQTGQFPGQPGAPGVVPAVPVVPQKKSRTGLIVGIVVAAAVLIVAGILGWRQFSGASYRDDAGRITEATTISSDKVRVGDCLNQTGVSDDNQEIDVVPCATAHDAEVFAVDANASSTDISFIENYCLTEFESYVGVSYYDSTLDIYYIYPMSAGTGATVCMASLDGAQWTDSIQGSGI